MRKTYADLKLVTLVALAQQGYFADIAFLRVRKSRVCKDGYLQAVVILDGQVRERAEHRIVVEQSIGRRLSKDEVVHHKDGNKLNNDLSNLEVVSRREHNRQHGRYVYRRGKRVIIMAPRSA